MAGSSLLTLLDDIASVLDDVAILTKVAAKKTAGVLGDDLALNAEQVAGVRAERELPVVWAVAKGSFRNKAILVPSALGLSVFAPWLVTPLLMLGGAYLCFEGAEKLAHAWFHRRELETEHAATVQALADPEVDLVAHEKAKIKGAIRTDFILSAEIIVIALGTVKTAALSTRIGVVTAIALVMTVGVYGFVGALVKLDDLGALLLKRSGKGWQWIGQALLVLTPRLMKALSIAGTAAMFLVGGGILLHGAAHGFSEHLEHLPIPLLGSLASAVTGL
ncbi:MAG: DUF808 domain-containing protein, partial [Holophaga sp.]|nr:DUF808 domain-containing protein [Holophaga sp.]